MDRIPEDVLKTGLEFILQKKSEFDWDKKGIFIHNLSLSKQPISLFYSKRELIERYYREETVSVNSAKIIFLGDGDVGKTYTLKRLLNGGKRATDKDTYPTQTTHGVLIKPYHFTDSNGHYDIKLWDFGGQQIMHSMHRCFLTERSCYVVIISTRTDRDLLEQARYWLQTVSSFTPDSPVILLVNQWTKNLVGVDEYRLREEFVNLKQILYFSVVDAEDETFLTLKDAIAAQVRQLDGYGMEFPKSWHELMTDLENEKRYYIPKSTYYQKCFEKGLIYEDTAREEICEWLLDWFNDLGICFSYNKNSNSQILDSYELLNPQWLCRAAYVLINYGKQASDNGILTRKQIETILKETEPLDFDDLGSVSYEPEQIEYIMEILRKFQISYQLPDGRELIPVLCDDNSSGSARPEWFVQDEMQHTSYEFQYEYLPDTIIYRLMIFCYQSHYHVRYRWRRGMSVDFGSDDTSRLTAVIDSGSDTRSITIDIYSDGLIPCWQFLSKFREEILKINIELGLEAMEFIYMETEGVKDRFSVKYILDLRLKGWRYLPAVNYDGDYSIIDILGAAYGSENATLIEELLDSKNNKINDVLTLIERINDLLKRRDIKLTAKEILNNFFLEYQDKCPRFTDFQQYIKDNNSDELQKYLHIELKDLFKLAETQDTTRRAREVREILELLWKFYLVDSNRIKKVIISASTDVDLDADTTVDSNEKTVTSADEGPLTQVQTAPADNKDKTEQYKPKPSELEEATRLVLLDFEHWLKDDADRKGLSFVVEKLPVRQYSGLQFGYDVGMTIKYNNIEYRLRFECKDYTANISNRKQDKIPELSVSRYAYNLLEYYMESKAEINNRWVLVCPFGGLQNDFPERLFSQWNKDHTFIKIYAIMENGPSLTCKDFLSVNENAYKLIYKDSYDGNKTRNDVFNYLFKKIVGKDDVREAVLKRLAKYSFWRDYGGHRGLLPVPDKKSQIALRQIFEFLARNKNTGHEQKKTLFIIGAYGTGKSWLCFQAIEQIISHPSDYPFMPFYLPLKDLSQYTDLTDETLYKSIMADTLRNYYKDYDEWAKDCVQEEYIPIFFLDGFDEVFSGLSATDKKINFLLTIIEELKDWYESYENERDWHSHTEPLFIITSRESDFEVGMKSEKFQRQMDQSEIIELDICSVEEVQNGCNRLEKEYHIDMSWIFKLEQNSTFLNIIRRPVFYRLCTTAFKDSDFKDKVGMASVDEVDVLDRLFEFELQNYKEIEGIDKNEIKEEIYRCAVKCSIEKKSQVVYKGKGINKVIHVGMVKIEKNQEIDGTCWVSFEHNIVREYLTARYLCQCLIDCSSEESDDPMSTTFVQTLQELSLTPEALKLFLLCIEKASPSDSGKYYTQLLKKWLCNKKVKKSQSRLPAKLLEILLQPGYILSGEKGDRLNLSGIRASNLCLWNCGLRHINFSQAELRNWQMINIELDDVDLRNANMEGLRLAPDKPISSICHWKDTEELHVAALHENGQLLQYNFPDNSWKNYSASILSKTEVKDGLFRFGKELLLHSVEMLYDEKNNKLYQIRSNKKLKRIMTASDFCGVITKQKDNCNVVVFQENVVPTAFIFKTNEPGLISLTEMGQVLYVVDGAVNLINHDGVARRLCKWEKDYECFTACSGPADKIYIYIKCNDNLIRITFDEGVREKTSSQKVLQIQGETEKIRELRMVNENALAAVGKNDLFILSIENNKGVEKVKSYRLKTDILFKNSLLEDEGGRNRLQDRNAYELLRASMC